MTHFPRHFLFRQALPRFFILQTEPSAGTVSSFRIRYSVQKGRSLPWWTQGWNTSLNFGRFSSVCSEAGEILWTAKQYYQNGSTKVCLRATWICWARHPLPSNMHEKSITTSFIFPTWKRNGLIVIVDSVFSIANVKHFLQYLSYLRFFLSIGSLSESATPFRIIHLITFTKSFSSGHFYSVVFTQSCSLLTVCLCPERRFYVRIFSSLTLRIRHFR